MKRLALVLFFLTEVMALNAFANPGDTTLVTIYNQRKLTYYGNYDTTATLPTGKRYRKIRLHYILGRYACPSGSQYCGSWDYTTQVYAQSATSDSVEIARVITPYATDWLSGSVNRKHDFIMDVTDYASVLDGNMEFRFVYQGYSYGFTVTLQLELIEGVPPMDALGVKNIYDGYFPFGRTSDPIESHLVATPMQYSAPAAVAMIKNSVSGHGSDDNECSEFCSKYYTLNLNGTQIAQKQLWRDNCGSNDVYPQTGTWVYERANWCPGAIVWPIYHDVTALTTAGNTFTVDVDMQPYTAPNQSNSQAGYNFISQLISYSAPNHTRDVSIEEIIAPTNDPQHLRANNICSHPIVRIKNTGTTPVTSVVFTYNQGGGAPQSFTWNGSLAFLEEAEVDLGPAQAMFNANISGTFEVAIASVNGTAGDDVSDNNTYKSTYTAVKSYTNKFAVVFTTNGSTDQNTGKNETTWKITDASGTVVASRSGANNNTIYRDTVNLPSGCYKLTIEDAGCDGLYWWANPNDGAGSLRFGSVVNPSIIRAFPTDFGCGYEEQFTIGYALGVDDLSSKGNSVTLFPTPASTSVSVLFDVQKQQDVVCEIYDLTGHLVRTETLKNVGSDPYTLSVEELKSGMYMVHFRFDDSSVVTQKLMISK